MTISHDEAQPNFRAPTAVITDYLRRSISVSNILERIWSGRLIVTVATLAGLACGAFFIHYDGPKYTATMWVLPAETDTGFSGGPGPSNFLADFAGNSGAANVPKFTQFLSAIFSVGVARDLDRKYGMLCRIYCDPITHRWREQTGARAFFNRLLARLGGLPDPNGPPTANDLADYIAGKVISETNKKNSIVILSFSHSKPEFAAQFLSATVKVTNDYVKAQNREIQRHYVEYLTQSVAKNTNIEQRQALDTLLLQQERQLMLTEVDVPYAATILDGPATTPVNHIAKTLLIFAIAGFILGVIIAIYRNLLRRGWRFQ